MKSSMVSLALAAPAMAFQPAPAASTRPATSLNSLRDIASFPDDMKMMSEFEAFDRNGAFSRSPQGGMGGRPEMMQYMGGGGGGYGGGEGYNPNPFARRGGNDRMYTRDGFDPYSAYGNSFGMSQSDNRRRGRGNGGGGGSSMDYYGYGPDMMNGVRNDNTMGGFSYSSRVRETPYGGGRSPYDYEMEMMGGGGFEGGPMGGGGMGGMEYEQYGPNMGGGGGYGGFPDDANPARREHPAGPQRPPSSSRPQRYSQGSRNHS